jgi:hypothetical protein
MNCLANAGGIFIENPGVNIHIIKKLQWEKL